MSNIISICWVWIFLRFDDMITLDLILSGLVYVVLIYFMITLLKKRKRSTDSDDDNDGGISVSGPPQLDLPPGVCLPDDPVRKIREEEEVFI